MDACQERFRQQPEALILNSIRPTESEMPDIEGASRSGNRLEAESLPSSRMDQSPATLGSPLESKELPECETCWALLERIAASAQLKRAIRLQELLFYVGKRYLKGDSEAVHEQQIGVEVFRRPQGYDTSADNIVRTNVSDLRKRIQSYFQSEGRDETLIMEIPRGSYIPVFKSRPAAPQMIPSTPSFLSENPERGLAETDRESVREPRQHSWMIAALIGSAAMMVVLAAGCTYFWLQSRSLRRSIYAWQYESSVSALWTGILGARPDTDVVLADASFGLLQDLNRRTFPLDDYLNRGYISQLQGQSPSPEMQTILNRIVLWNLGSQDDFKLAERILALDPQRDRIHLYSARDYMPELTNRDNVILIGSNISNPWDKLFEGRMNFAVKFGTDGTITIANRAPVAGEQAIYTQADSTEYCVVGYLPNPDHNGVVLLIEGTGAEATEAAGDFLLSNDQLSAFRKLLHGDKFPYFEVLLKVSSVPGTPLTEAVEAYRAYPNLN